MADKICTVCTQPYAITSWDMKRGRGKYCSKKCYNQSRTSKPYTYHAVHTWLWRNYRTFKTGNCSHCTRIGVRSEWANVSGHYILSIDDYKELCKPCHERFDNHRHDHFSGHKHSEASKQKISISVKRNRWGLAA